MCLKNFQEKIGASPDGIFGKETLEKAMKFYSLSKEQISHFFGQVGHETGEFKLFEENLNYSTSGLLSTFKKYFPTKDVANQYARQPQKIANKVYASRMGNGNESSGDGWKYRGRGALQLTGKSNYLAFSIFVKDSKVVEDPELVLSKYCFESAIFYFTKNNLWDKCLTVNDTTIFNITKRVNGGTNGLSHRNELTKKYYKLLNS